MASGFQLCSLYLFASINFCSADSSFQQGNNAFDHASISLTRFSYAELQALMPGTRSKLRRALRAEGAVLLTDIPAFDKAATEALDVLGDCLQQLKNIGAENEFHENEADMPILSPVLAQGGVERWTVATSTEAGAQQPLPASVGASCPLIIEPVQSLRSFTNLLLGLFARSADTAAEPLGDTAAEAEAAAPPFVERLSQPMQVPPVATGIKRPRLQTLESIVRQGTILEHFHRYVRTEHIEKPTEPTLVMHTDAGMLQALVVRWRYLHGLEEVSGLELQFPGGRTVMVEAEAAATAFDGSSITVGILFLLGQGTEEWLQHLGFRAAPHALRAPAVLGIERLVYGVMVLPPADMELPSSNTTFRQWWQQAQQVVGDNGNFNDTGCMPSALLSRRLQDQALTCPAGSVYCWMQCVTVQAELSCGTEQALCISEKTGDVCPQSDTHDASCRLACPPDSGDVFMMEVSQAGEAGVNGAYIADSWSGGRRLYRQRKASEAIRILWDDHWASLHFGQWLIVAERQGNRTVLYYSEYDSKEPPKTGWQALIGSLPAPKVSHADSQSSLINKESKSQFCNGILTDMHMLGFTWSRPHVPCLIFLFPGWELTDAARFWMAAVGTVAAGIFAEYLVALRRWESARQLPVVAKGTRPLSVMHQAVNRAPRHLLYAVTRSMGYFVMLISMTYSGELFVAVIVGLTLGHAFFNSSISPDQDATPCCPASSSGNTVVLQVNPQAPARKELVDSEVSHARLRFQVSGMTCNACTYTVTRAVESLTDVQKVIELSLSTGTMEVALTSLRTSDEDHDTEAERICSVVESVGFGAQLARPSKE
mmetsp:Transcript_36430/g.70127  ORF Transcript_36430/g.70127 Transcript_36430/m.70127 type:complete len:826 (-) Transcript_36430:116-2593(-)